ncbi:unnamed protein product [Moneuplotes crassus]|uniref:Uncharacterized protein n=1 Tax=Euplotes crassus TaxID=5936 RepID=A0AAD1Y4T1_EUPCR|nr:unnamed protein product [Moneuplotes crassus]
MEKVFVTTKNNDISIKELWDQINKIKESIGSNKTRDGVYISSESIPQIERKDSKKDPKSHKSKKRNSKEGSDINNLSVSLDLKDKSNGNTSNEVSQDNFNSILLLDGQEDKNQRIIDLLSTQAQKIRKLEKKLKDYKHSSNDKIETLEADLKILTQTRMNDLDNMLKNIQKDFDKFQDSQKTKDYNMRTHLKDTTYDLEVSIKSLKRNLLALQNEVHEINEAGTQDKLQEDQKSEKAESTKSAKLSKKDNSSKAEEPQNFTQKISSPTRKKATQNSNAIVMVWEEIEKLQSKFDDFVNVADFEELADDVDDLKDQLAQISQNNKSYLNVKDLADNEFSESEALTPANVPIGKESLEKIKEFSEAKEAQNTPNTALKVFQDNKIKKISTEEQSEGLTPTGGLMTPGVARLNNDLTSKVKIQHFSTSVKDESPSKISQNRRNTRGKRGGSSKTLQEVRKIIEKWPWMLETIEELQSSQKLNYKNIFQVGENLSELKNEIKENVKKRIDSVYNTITEETKKVEDNIAERLDNFKDKHSQEAIKTLQLQVEKLSLQFGSTYKQLKSNEGKIKELDEYLHSPFGNLLHGNENSAEDSAITELRDTVEDVKKVLNKMRTEVYRTVKDCENKILQKADEELVNDLEEALHQGIDQVMTSSTKKFADRRDTNKSVRLLEQNMKNMYDLFVSREELGDTDDAMIAKKNLGFTCMSCEKHIINMEGKKAEFNNWGKLPYRDPSERMMRVGHGFSKMLNSIKTSIPKNTEGIPKTVLENSLKSPGDITPNVKSTQNLSIDPNPKTDANISPNASNTLQDLNKTEDRDKFLSMKPKKISLSVMKQSAHKKESMRKSLTVMNKNNSQGGLPKIESSKML